MNTKEPALLASMATIFSLVVCQLLVRLSGQSVHLSRAQLMSGLTICLAGVAVGLMLVLCVSVFQEYSSGLGRSLGAFGLALGCALLLALLMGHRPARAQSTSQASSAAHADHASLLAPGSWR